MKYTTVMLAMALLMVPLVSATAMAQMTTAEVSEERAQTTTEALGSIDLISTLLGGGIGAVVGGGVGTVLAGIFTAISVVIALVVDLFDTAFALIVGLVPAGFMDIIDTVFALFVDSIEALCVVPIGWLAGLVGIACGTPLAWITTVLCAPCTSWSVDLLDTCVALCGAWIPAAIVDGLQSCSYWIGDIILGIWSLITPIWAVCFSAIGNALNGMCTLCYAPILDIIEAVCVMPPIALCVDAFYSAFLAIFAVVADVVDTIIGGIWSCCTPLYAVACSACGNLLNVIGTLIMDVLDTCAALCIAGIIDAFDTIVAWITDIVDTLLAGCMTLVGALWAGLNDVDLGSYLFQSAKICAFAIGEPALYIWNCFGLLHVIPCVSWIMALCHGFFQLILLWINFVINGIQHIAPVV